MSLSKGLFRSDILFIKSQSQSPSNLCIILIYPCMCLQCISSSLCPKEFCKHLLNFVMTCSMAQKNSILNALRMLIQQEVIDKESLSTGLLVCLENYIHKNMVNEILIY